MNLEGQVHDVDRLAEIAESFVCEWSAETVDLPRSGELAACMAGILRDKVRVFKEEYLAAFDAGRLRG